MRITGGRWLGRRLNSPPRRSKIRPSSDANREALFSILEHNYGGVADSIVLDLFAGSGTMGLEALSRHATAAVFIDNDIAALNTIEQNIRNCAAETLSCTVLRKELRRQWRYPKTLPPADLVIMDPPYSQDIAGLVLDNCLANNCLAPDCLIIVEQPHENRNIIPSSAKSSQKVTIIEKRDRKNSCFWFLRYHQ